MNNNKTRGISGLSILLCVLVLAGVYWFMSQSDRDTEDPAEE